MAVTKRYDDLLQVPIEGEFRARVKVIADREDISEAQVVRDLVYAGIDARETLSYTSVPAGENDSQVVTDLTGHPLPPAAEGAEGVG